MYENISTDSIKLMGSEYLGHPKKRVITLQ